MRPARGSAALALPEAQRAQQARAPAIEQAGVYAATVKRVDGANVYAVVPSFSVSRQMILRGVTAGLTVGTRVWVAFSDREAVIVAREFAAPIVTGSRGGNAALASLLTRLAAEGLIIDATTA